MNYSVVDFWGIAPQLVVIVFGFIVFFVDLWLPRGLKSINGILSLVGLLCALFVSVYMFGHHQVAFKGMAIMDRMSNFTDIIILSTSILAVVMGFGFLEREEINTGEYYTVLLFSVAAMQFFASTYNLIVMLISVETLSIGMYILTGFLKDGKGVEGSLKYFILGGFASGFLVLGIGLVYGLFRSVDLNIIRSGLIHSDSLHTWVTIIAFVMLLIGFGFKIAAFPFHAWTPDVYASAPTPMSGFMSVAPKAATFVALMRLLSVGMAPIEVHWQSILWIIAVLTMTFGNTVALWQKDLKRLLGYSSIAHAGYILVGFVAANALGYGAALFYLFGYVFMNLGAFAIAEFISKRGDVGTEISNLRGLGYKYPLMGAAMLVFMFSLAGVPPTVGFVGKYYLFSAAIKSGFYWLVVIAVINSAVSAYFYLNIVVTMYMKGEPDSRVAVFASPLVKLVVFVGVLGTLFLGVFPSYILSTALSSVGL